MLPQGQRRSVFCHTVVGMNPSDTHESNSPLNPDDVLFSEAMPNWEPRQTDKTAGVHWEGQGKKGLGHISTETGALKAYPYGFAARFEADRRGANPEKTVNVGRDAGVVDANDREAFIAAAKTRQWEWEKSVRTLA